MKIRYILLSLIVLASLCSCGKKVILDEDRTFANDTWLRFQPEQFSVTPGSPDDCYNFLLTLTIDTARFHESGLPIMMEIESPEHEKRTLFSTILLRNHEGHWLGSFDEHGNIIVTQPIRQYFFFSTASTHSISLGQRTNKYEIKGIRSLNLKVEKAKLEYPE
ncbi:MAG: hypothetical protein IKG81_14265 [Bacteroidales bacterium]|nr:hypothetical protein [Bacteroidales bacterium]